MLYRNLISYLVPMPWLAQALSKYLYHNRIIYVHEIERKESRKFCYYFFKRWDRKSDQEKLALISQCYHTKQAYLTKIAKKKADKIKEHDKAKEQDKTKEQAKQKQAAEAHTAEEQFVREQVKKQQNQNELRAQQKKRSLRMHQVQRQEPAKQSFSHKRQKTDQEQGEVKAATKQIKRVESSQKHNQLDNQQEIVRQNQSHKQKYYAERKNCKKHSKLARRKRPITMSEIKRQNERERQKFVDGLKAYDDSETDETSLFQRPKNRGFIGNSKEEEAEYDFYIDELFLKPMRSIKSCLQDSCEENSYHSIFEENPSKKKREPNSSLKAPTTKIPQSDEGTETDKILILSNDTEKKDNGKKAHSLELGQADKVKIFVEYLNSLTEKDEPKHKKNPGRFLKERNKTKLTET